MKKTPVKTEKKAHRLLAAYWLINVFMGKNPLKTTVRVLKVERNSIRKVKEKERQGIAEQKSRLKSKTSAGKAAVRKSAAATGQRTLFRKGIKKILKAERVV